MPRLTPCSACNAHVLSNERACPHCGETLRSHAASKSAAVLMGLALAGCPSNGEPEYGVPDTDSMSTSTGTTTSDTAEPEYGVPDTAGPDSNGVPPTKQ